MTIVSIGGGEIKLGETLAIDEYIVEAARKKNPRVLFVPTASRDAEPYCQSFLNLYGEELGCEVSFLKIAERNEDSALIADLVEAADIVYVGGGNTRFMMDQWAHLGIDRLLSQVERTGTVLAGLSAGAICWYESGLSDSNRFYEESEWAFSVVDGLGLRPGIFCPHLDVERRHAALVHAVTRTQKTAIACDNGSAIAWNGAEMTVLRSLPNAQAYCYRPDGDGVSIEVISGNDGSLPSRVSVL